MHDKIQQLSTPIVPIEACFNTARLRPYFEFRDVSLSEILHRLLYIPDKHLCKFSERETSRNLKYNLKRSMSKHASIESIARYINIDRCVSMLVGNRALVKRIFYVTRR